MYPMITPLCYSSFNFLFHYPYISPKSQPVSKERCGLTTHLDKDSKSLRPGLHGLSVFVSEGRSTCPNEETNGRTCSLAPHLLAVRVHRGIPASGTRAACGNGIFVSERIVGHGDVTITRVVVKIMVPLDAVLE